MERKLDGVSCSTCKHRIENNQEPCRFCEDNYLYQSIANRELLELIEREFLILAARKRVLEMNEMKAGAG